MVVWGIKNSPKKFFVIPLLYTCAIAFDINKSFDSVNHTILLKKLSHCGIRGVFLNIYESYLENQKQ